jgi:phosphoribosylformylglycinamidine synthase
VVFRYLGGNPNGAVNDVAGITSADGRVVGLMPHPEHAIDPLTGPSSDGLDLFRSAVDALLASVRA